MVKLWDYVSMIRIFDLLRTFNILTDKFLYEHLYLLKAETFNISNELYVQRAHGKVQVLWM